MGGLITPSKEEEILKFMRQDDAKRLQSFLLKYNLPTDALYTSRNRTLIQLGCYFESPKCVEKLIEMNYDYNQTEFKTGNTPLYIACQFNCLKIVKALLAKENCKKLVKNELKLNEFDIAFLKGNYPICYYLLYEYKDKSPSKDNISGNINDLSKENNTENDNIEGENDIYINENLQIQDKFNKDNINYDRNHPYQKYFFNKNFDLEIYTSLQGTNKYPYFNMPLFFDSLCKKIAPEDCESFAPERKRTKELQTKIPDPNETWGHFFKRMVNFELYTPPLVDKRNVSQMNSLYMNTQMKLIENEYGVKLNFYQPEKDKNENDDDEEEEQILTVKKKVKKKKKTMEKKEDEEDKKVGDEDDNEKEDKRGNLCALKVKDSSSERKMNENTGPDEE